MRLIPENVLKHEAVTEVGDDATYLRVKSHGNCSLFGRINRSDYISLGNVSSFDNGDLKVGIVASRQA